MKPFLLLALSPGGTWKEIAVNEVSDSVRLWHFKI